MPRRPEPLSRALRRAAARGAGHRGKRPSPAVVDAARAGVLTRSNTAPGSAGRRAVDAATYARRQVLGRRRAERRGEPAPSARAAVGHGRPFAESGRTMSSIFVGEGFILVDNLTRGEARRVARWNARAGELKEGQLTPGRFRQLVAAWEPFRGMNFESDPAVVVAQLVELQEAGEAPFVYRRRS